MKLRHLTVLSGMLYKGLTKAKMAKVRAAGDIQSAYGHLMILTWRVPPRSDGTLTISSL
jgi:hypothetical protein